MIIHAGYNMIPALKKLWKEAFGDDDRYIDFFFNNRFRGENTFVYMKNGFPVSMATVLNASLYCNGAFLPAGYIYGVATSAVHRGKGLSTAILEHINGIYPATFLVPAAGELFDFYKKRGFTPAFSLNEFNLHACDLQTPPKKITGKPVSPGEYKAIRDCHFQKNGYICWDTEAISYALAENSFFGGAALKIQTDEKKGENGVLLYRKQSGRLLIIETTLPMPILQDAAHNLMKQENAGECSVRLASNETSIGRPFGLLRQNTAYCAATVKNGYCSLVLD